MDNRMNQVKTPLYTALLQHKKRKPYSFHVPGHKSGAIMPKEGEKHFQDIMGIDLTEITGLDDLHHPQESIKEAQQLVSSYFGAIYSFFLVGGSTVGNLAMVLATYEEGKPILVQRNCHKSIIHALELAGAHPVFLQPAFEEETGRYGPVSEEQVKRALKRFPNAAGLILTYPDYYGRTFNLKSMIAQAHEQDIPVLIDEAHGVHFSLGSPLPPSSLDLGADVVVQSAHKMAPAMTMGAYLHIGSTRVDQQKIANYLQMVQSSSPSYPIMASLDLARKYLANFHEEKLDNVLEYNTQVRKALQSSPVWDVLATISGKDDPFKITLQIREGYDAQQVADSFESEGIFPEFTTDREILLILGLEPTIDIQALEVCVHNVNAKCRATKSQAHATIEQGNMNVNQSDIQTLPLSYKELNRLKTKFISWSEAEGKIASSSVVPYPPGIPLIMKGERIQTLQIGQLEWLVGKQVHIQTQETNIKEGIHIYIE